MNRRNLLRGSVAAAAGSLLVPGAAAAYVPGGRPILTHGVQSGEPRATSALVWTRADRPSRLLVEYSHRPDFRGARHVRGPVLTPGTDFTGKVALRDLDPGTQVFYRVRAESLDRHGVASDWLTGRLTTASTGRHRGVRFVWTGDVNGQGWGINPDLGGMRIFDAMGRVDPDFYLCSGDTVYSDGPITAAVTLPDGRVYRNLTDPAKDKVAETLAEYRGQFAYNLLDENLKAFAARVPQINQWDDHEVRNNWYPGQILADDRYTEKNVDVLASRARQAFFEYVPIASGEVYRKFSFGPLLDVFVLDMRTYKDPNSSNVYADPHLGMLGARQRRWLIDGLTHSKATWKVIANDLPLGLVVPDGASAQEGVAQGDGGAPLGRELEFAEVLRTVHRRGVDGIVFLTADVHYTAAHHYDPARAAIGDFSPFWEFVSGPANAGAFGPNALDATFGPEAVFVHAPPAANTSPLDPAYQHFGEVDIDGHSGDLTVRLRDATGAVLFTRTLTR
ncbi:alkaline phosphatase D family protein [Hamadaea tsunoensis]|uniref:alkaline phosphatase D family protein n=1 Tax=Hamadaea tsunoensis TaxID=53368 RepID=UPI00040E5352|nr:alkaline phosphatase D family protein [Hamadaea tsunoensis]